MDLEDMLPQLEEIANKIHFQPLDDLLNTGRNLCEHT